MYSHDSMFLHMFNLFYDFSVIFIVLVCLLWLLAEWVVPFRTPVNFDNLLLGWDLPQKLHNKFYNVCNNNNNVSKFIQKIYQLYTTCQTQLVAGGWASGELLYVPVLKCQEVGE